MKKDWLLLAGVLLLIAHMGIIMDDALSLHFLAEPSQTAKSLSTRDFFFAPQFQKSFSP